MIRDGYGQIVYETLPHILLSNASLVTKSCIARFVEGDAFNPSALSNCSTGPSPPLAHAKSTLSPSRASAGCLQPGLFGRFRSICQQTAHRSRKIRAQCEIPPFHVLLLGFRVPRWKRNDTFLRAFVKRLLFFASHMASVVETLPETVLAGPGAAAPRPRGQSVWAAAEGRGRRADLTCQPPTRTNQ